MEGTEATPVSGAPENSAEVPSTPTPAAQQDEPWRKVKHKVKVNGQEKELDYDDIIRRAQIAEASDEKFKTAKQLEREVMEFLKTAKTDPSLFFKTLGLDEDQYYEEKRRRKEALAQLTEEQREILELRQRQADYERKERERAEEDENRQRSAMIERAQAELDQEIVSAFTATGMTKPSPRLVKRVAETMYSYLEATGKRLPAQKALEHVIQEDEQDRLSAFDTEDVSKILPKLPKKFLDAIRKADIESLKSKQSYSQPKPQQDAKEPVKLDRKKFRTTNDIFEELEKKLRKK